MKKYRIGILILGAVTVVLTIYVLVLGIQSRQDTKTNRAANEAATKLNDYVSKNQKIPNSLSEVGVENVPSTISYDKISSKQYKFCVTYKADEGSGGSDITSSITGAALTRLYGGYSGDYNSQTDKEESYLYLSYRHKKGEECHKVKPYLYSSSSLNTTTDYCSPSYQYYEQYKSYCATQDDAAQVN